MADTTVYDVSVRYSMDDRASAALNNLAGTAARTEKSVMGLKDTFLAIGATIGVGRLWDKGKEAFITFNSSVEQAKIGIAGVQRLFDKSLSGEAAKKQAEDLFGAYQKEAIASTATTQEFLNMHLALAPAAKRAGASLAEMQKIVTGSTIAAPILLPNTPDAAAMFARDIESMLSGTVTARDRAAKTLISSMGSDVKSFNEKAKSDPSFAVQFINRALNQKSLVEMRKDMEGSFAGVTSTLQDMVQILLGEMGQPLFKLVTEEIKGWNKWLMDNQKLVKDTVREVGEGLVKGFHAVKDVVKFLVDNRETIFAIGKIWLASKVMSGAGASLAGGLGGAGINSGFLAAIGQMSAKGGLSTLASAVPEIASGFASMVNPLTLVVAGLTAFYLGLSKVAEAFETQQRGRLAGSADFGSIRDVALAKHVANVDVARGVLFNRAKELGLISDEGMFKKGDARTTLERLAVSTDDSQAALKDVPRIVMAFGALFESMGPEEVKRRLGGASGTAAEKQGEKPISEKAKLNVTIHKIEVPAADPDRFVHQMVKKFEDVVRNPTSAESTLRGR